MGVAKKLSCHGSFAFHPNAKHFCLSGKAANLLVADIIVEQWHPQHEKEQPLPVTKTC